MSRDIYAFGFQIHEVKHGKFNPLFPVWVVCDPWDGPEGFYVECASLGVAEAELGFHLDTILRP